MESTGDDPPKVDFAEVSSASDSESEIESRIPSQPISTRKTRRVRWKKKELKTLQKMVEKQMENTNKMSDEDWGNAARALNEKFPETANRTAITVQRQWDIYKNGRPAQKPWTKEEISMLLRLGNNKETSKMRWADIAAKFRNRLGATVCNKYRALIAEQEANSSDQVENDSIYLLISDDDIIR